MEDRKDTAEKLHDDESSKPSEMKERGPFIPAMTRGLCQGLVKTYEHRKRIHEEIKSALKGQIFNVPSVVSPLEWSNTRNRDT